MSELAAMQQRVAELGALASHRKHAQTAAQQAATTYAEAMIDTVREPLLLLDEHLKVLSANRRTTPPLRSGIALYHGNFCAANRY